MRYTHKQQRHIRRMGGITVCTMNLVLLCVLALPSAVSGYEEAMSQSMHTRLTGERISGLAEQLQQPVTVDFRNVDLISVLNYLADATGVNIIPSAGVRAEDHRTTIHVNDLPLDTALKYILLNQGLVYRVEPFGVWVATEAELEQEEVETRIYYLNVGVGLFTKFQEPNLTEPGELGQGGNISAISTIKDLLSEAVSFQGPAKITLDERSGALIVTNTPNNLTTIESILSQIDVMPVQMLIEARFVQVNVNDVEELGLETRLKPTTGEWGIKSHEGIGPRIQLDGGTGTNFTDFVNQANGLNLTYQGVVTHPEFEIILHNLNTLTNTKTLSAPRVMTLNNQTATIQVVDEFIFPTRFEVTLIQFDKNGDGDFDDAGETEFVNAPQEFVTRNIGILLRVTPNVGHDRRTVTMSVVPEVSDLDEFRTFAGDVTLPEFTTSKVATTVVIQDGETVIMGGLLDHDRTKVVTKVPFLGDLPLIGGLFRKTADTDVRKNLFIFVTVNIIDPLNLDQDTETLASTL